MQAAEKAALPEAAAIDKQVNQDLVPKILALNDPFQEVRSHIGSLTYEIEVSNSESRKDSLRKQIDELKAEVHKVKLAGRRRSSQWKFADMDANLQAMKAKKAELLQQRVEVMKHGHRAARRARQVSLGPHRRRQRPIPSRPSRTRSPTSISASARST